MSGANELVIVADELVVEGACDNTDKFVSDIVCHKITKIHHGCVVLP